LNEYFIHTLNHINFHYVFNETHLNVQNQLVFKYANMDVLKQ